VGLEVSGQNDLWGFDYSNSIPSADYVSQVTQDTLAGTTLTYQYTPNNAGPPAPPVVPVPPSLTMAAIGMGMAGLGYIRRRRMAVK
jgi:hypothetical protein